MQHFCQMLEALQHHHLGLDSNMIDEIRCSTEASSWPRTDFITFEIAFMGGFVQMHMFRTSRSTE
jgi:hypothetical protein